MTDTHDWVRPKLARGEKERLTARWAGLDLTSVIASPPFGQTAQGRVDLRYLPLQDKDRRRPLKWRRLELQDADLSGACLDWLLAEHCRFTNCVFDRTSLIQFSDKGSVFDRCVFHEADLRLGALGTDWNTSKKGEYESVYTDCLFRNLKLSKLIVGDPVFRQCRFQFKRLSTVNWQTAGFWNCTFEGVFHDMMFHGKYLFDEETLRKGRPLKAGLHQTSFRNARLHWISLRFKPPIEDLEMPSDGSSFVVDLDHLMGDVERIYADCPDSDTRALVERYLDLMGDREMQGTRAIFSLDDLLGMAVPGDRSWVFERLREYSI